MTKLSWEEVEQIVKSLTVKIKASGFEPDWAIGIAMGGLIPLYFLAKELDIDNVVTVSASSYNEEGEKGELVINYLPIIDLSGKKVLLVDEVAETGKTLERLTEIVRSKYSVKELKTAVLATNTEKCTFRPDFIGLENNGWIVFPWERRDFPEYF